MATIVGKRCAMALGKAISNRTSIRPSATKTCRLSMQRPGQLLNGFGTTALLTKSTQFADLESKQPTHMPRLSCLMLSMQEALAKMSTHLKLSHISLQLRLAICTTRTRAVTMVPKNSLLKVMQNFKAHALAKMLTSTSSKKSLRLSLEATTKTVTLAPSIITIHLPVKVLGTSLPTT